MQNQCIVPNNDKTFTSIQNKKFDIQDKINKIKCYINEIKNIYDIVELCVADDFANEDWLKKLKDISDDAKVNLYIPSYKDVFIEGIYTSVKSNINGLTEAIEKSIKPMIFSDSDENKNLDDKINL